MNKKAVFITIGLMTLALIGLIVLQLNWINWSLKLSEQQFDKNVFSALNKVADRLQAKENDEALNYINGYEATYLEGQATKLLDDSVITDEGAKNSTEYQKNEFTLPDNNFSRMLIAENNCSCTKCQFERWFKYNRIVNNYRIRSSVPLAERIELATLDRILKEELTNTGIDIQFNYGVYDSEHHNFIITDNHYVVAPMGQTKASFQAGGDDHLKKSKYQVSLFGLSDKSPGSLMVYFQGRANALWSGIWKTVLASMFFTLIVLGGFIYTVIVIFQQKQVSEMKNDFINNMTHEFKTPLATISLAVDSITNPQIISNPDKVKRFVNIIKQENTRMNGQVEKVLQMAIIDKKDFNLNFSKIDIHDIINKAVDNFALQISRREGVINTNLTASNHEIFADQTHISNIIYNLLDNANKYSGEKPEILITTKDARDGVEIIVKDNGIGISKEAKKHIFDRFYRVHTGNVHDVKGFGLGLSYVKTMTQAHNGHIDVISEPGKGSSFIITLPVRQS